MKSITLTAKLSTIAAVAALLGAGCTSPEPQVKARQDPNLTSITQVTSGYDTWGRQWGEPDKAPPTPTAPSAPAMVKTSCMDSTGGLVGLSKRMPPEVNLGQQFWYELDV